MAGEVVPYQGKRRYGGKGAADRLAVGERVLALRNEGLTMPMVCRELGISDASAKRYMALVLDTRVPPTVDNFRRQQNDRLDATQRTITENMEYADWLGREGLKQESMAMVQQAIQLRSQQVTLQLKLDERRARLNGLDAPVKVDATVTQVDPADAELAEMIREMKAKSANEEATRG